jgi:hypothetical protein
MSLQEIRMCECGMYDGEPHVHYRYSGQRSQPLFTLEQAVADVAGQVALSRMAEEAASGIIFAVLNVLPQRNNRGDCVYDREALDLAFASARRQEPLLNQVLEDLRVYAEVYMEMWEEKQKIKKTSNQPAA